MLSGTPATQLFSLDGTPQMVVGVPLPSVQRRLLRGLLPRRAGRHLRILAFALAPAALVTTVAGAVIGRWASGRALRPLAGVSRGRGGHRRRPARHPAARPDDDPDLAGLASSFNRMADQLQERIEREARFTSDVSHELRSPLTTLAASLGVLEAHRDELPPAAPAGPRPARRPTCGASSAWSTTCSRSAGSTPGRPSSPRRGRPPASWSARRSAADVRAPARRPWPRRHGRDRPGRRRRLADRWTSAGSSG